jgi:molybdenum cofactor guanylyltransferase
MGAPKHTLKHAESGKSLLSYQCERLAPHFSQVLLLTGKLSVEKAVPGQRVVDPPDFEGEGPLAGLLAAMKVASTPWVALLAIDQPRVPPEQFERALHSAELSDQAIVAKDTDNRIQWLCGLYRTSLGPELERQLGEGVRAVKRFGRSVNLKLVPTQEKGAFVNLNTPEDAVRYGWLLSEGTGEGMF